MKPDMTRRSLLGAALVLPFIPGLSLGQTTVDQEEVLMQIVEHGAQPFGRLHPTATSHQWHASHLDQLAQHLVDCQSRVRDIGRIIHAWRLAGEVAHQPGAGDLRHPRLLEVSQHLDKEQRRQVGPEMHVEHRRLLDGDAVNERLVEDRYQHGDALV
jgi:hypothetical protein